MQLCNLRCLQEEVGGQRCHAPDVVTSLLQQHASSSVVVERIADTCSAAATASEDTKCKLMECPFSKVALDIISNERVTLAATAALCTALKSLMVNDDARPPASQAFMHARILGTDRGAVPVTLAALKRAEQEPAALHSVMSSLQQLCANDEICVRVRPNIRMCLHAHESNSDNGWQSCARLGLLGFA
jgi:hypothetical protein